MKRYLVKETSVATEENENYYGTMQTWYIGKGDKFIKCESIPPHYRDFDYTDWMLKDYGYKRLSDARRNWTFRNPDDTKSWINKVEIVEFEV